MLLVLLEGHRTVERLGEACKSVFLVSLANHGDLAIAHTKSLSMLRNKPDT